MAARARVKAVKIEENVDCTASCVMQVTSSSRCRSVRMARARRQVFGASAAEWTLIKIRNNELRLNMRIPVATGTTAISSMSTPS